MNLISELRMLAEDLHVNGYNRYSAAMSQAADELAKWEAVFGHLGDTPDECGNAIIAARDELEERLEAAENERDALRAETKSLREGLKRMCLDEDAAAKEANTLRAKIEAVEKQEPVAWRWELKAGQYTYIDKPEHAGKNARIVPLYALPGAQSQLNEIKIALQRALELGQRETWTGARKHRSREDQREEQQCWNKVWGLLGTQGEGK